MTGIQWAVLAVLGIAASVVLGSPIPMGFGIAIAVTLCFGLLTSRPTRRQAIVSREIDRTLIPVGESVVVRLRAKTGRKIGKAFGMRWTVVRDVMPENTLIDAPTGQLTFGDSALEAGFFYRTTFHSRGAYTLGPLEIRSGDIMGLRSTSWVDPLVQEVLVHPRVRPMRGFALRSNRSFGENRPDRRAAEDPTRPAGSRAYVAGDPLKRVHWKATARSGQLISKIYDGSSAPVYVVLLDRGQGSYVRESDFELACTTAASVVNGLLAERNDVGLLAGEQVVSGSGRVHEERCLAALARATLSRDSLSETLIRTRHELPWRATLVLVTSRLDARSAAALEIMRRAGHGVGVVLVGDESVTRSGLSAGAALGASVACIAKEEEIETARFIDASLV